MRKLVYFMIIFVLIGGIVLTAYAPDEISMAFIVMMEVIVFTGVFFGLFPIIQFSRAFQEGLVNIYRALEVQTSSTWSVMVQIENFFHQHTMDELFQEYQEKVQAQRDSGQVLADIEDYFNDDILGMKSWQNVVTQIPGTLTGVRVPKWIPTLAIADGTKPLEILSFQVLQRFCFSAFLSCPSSNATLLIGNYA